LDPFALGFFGEFIPKGENVGPKQACGLSLQVFQGYETKGGECEHKIKQRGKFDLGGVWMMVSVQASVSGSNSVNLCKFMLALVVLS
jgi:hypothetical protein